MYSRRQLLEVVSVLMSAPILRSKRGVAEIHGNGTTPEGTLTEFSNQFDTRINPEELKESIATPWNAPVSVPTWADRNNDVLWKSRMNNWVDRLATEGAQHAPVAAWTTLVLIYPNVDTDFKTPEGETKHFTGSLSAAQVANAKAVLAQFGAEINKLSGGFCKMTTEVRVIDRPVTFSGERANSTDPKNRYGFQHPEYAVDCLPEKRQFNDPQPYDNVIIVYNQGPVPQDLKGAGGKAGTQTVQHVQYGHDGEWNLNRLSNSLGVFVHEWIHGLDSFFMGLGYKSKALHHVYQFPDIHYNYNWHAAILQGRMKGPIEERYGYSRSSWLCGTPTKPRTGLLPIQLLSPLPGVSVPTGAAITFSWNKSAEKPAATSYQLLLYQLDNLTKPFMTADTKETVIEIETGLVDHGQYLWTVRAKNEAGRFSDVGESFPIQARPASSLQPIQVTSCETRDLTINLDTPYVMAAVSASSVCSIKTVYLEITYPSGNVQVQPLRIKSANENEPVWVCHCSFIVDPNHKGSLRLKRIAKVMDQGGRIASIKTPDILLNPQDITDYPEELMGCRPMDPLKLNEGYTFSTQKAVPFSPSPAIGGPYAFYVLLDGIWQAGGGNGTINAWAEFTGPDGTVERVGTERLGGVTYGQYLFQRNDGRARKYLVTFHVIKGGKHLHTAPFEIAQPGKTR